MTDFNVFNADLAKQLKNLKKDIGATSVTLGYRGTGKQAHRRQMWVKLPAKTIDLFLDGEKISLGGVCLAGYGKVSVDNRTVAEVYAEIVEKLNQ